jgi:hypothetical protein
MILFASRNEKLNSFHAPTCWTKNCVQQLMHKTFVFTSRKKVYVKKGKKIIQVL